MQVRTCSGELYRRLEIEKKATSEEVKRAYYRLSLRVHPDKTGGTTTEEFKLIQEAYSILSDPDRRSTYDMFGRSSANAMEALNLPTRLMLRIVFFGMFFFFLLLMIFVSLVVAKIDRKTDWRWVNVFTPVWILMAFVYLLCLVMLLVAVFKRILNFLPTTVLIILWGIPIINVAKSLDGRTSWGATFATIWIVVAINVINSFCGFLPSFYRKSYAVEGPLLQCTKYVSELAYSSFLIICFLIFLTLINVCVTSTALAGVSYFVIFSPLYASFIGISLFYALTKADAEPKDCKSVTKDVITNIFNYLAQIYTVLMISIKAEYMVNLHKTGPSAGVCALAIFIFLSFFLIITFVFGVFSEKVVAMSQASVEKSTDAPADANQRYDTL